MLVPGSEMERKYGALLWAEQGRASGTCSSSMPELVTLLASGRFADKVQLLQVEQVRSWMSTGCLDWILLSRVSKESMGLELERRFSQDLLRMPHR